MLMCSEKVFNGDLFENLPEVQRMDVCLSIFYCINWFRELVCALHMQLGNRHRSWGVHL